LKDDPFEEVIRRPPRSYTRMMIDDESSPDENGDCHDRQFAAKSTRGQTNGDHFEEENTLDDGAQVNSIDPEAVFLVSLGTSSFTARHEV
jgi:hypothetical protein